MRLGAWDTGWYARIAAQGYEYAPDGAQHSVAFFPAFPLLGRAVAAATGLDFTIAGALVSNVAFLLAVVIFHADARSRYGARAAAWATAALAFYPYALYGSVAYAEGLLLFGIVASIAAFRRARFGAAVAFGALATATKILALPLVPAFWLVARRRGLGGGAWLAGLGAGLGLAAYALYNAWAFGDPLAFVHVQAAWRGEGTSTVKEWLKALAFAPTGLARPVQPAFGLAAFAGGLALLWARRRELDALDLACGAFAALLIAASGPLSLPRFLVAVPALFLAAGLTFARRPPAGALVIAYFALTLAGLGLAFAFRLWIA